VNLSITHNSSAELEADGDIGQTRHATPNDGVARRRIVGTVEATCESCELSQA